MDDHHRGHSIVRRGCSEDLSRKRPDADGSAALTAVLGLWAKNTRLFLGLTDAQRARTLRHPDWGTITVADLIPYLTCHGGGTSGSCVRSTIAWELSHSRALPSHAVEGT